MKILEVLDSGGFGRVEKVELTSGDVVARKVFSPTAAVTAAGSMEKLRDRFKREVAVQSKLSSDYFIPILSSDLSSDPMWFTMPLCTRNFSDEITHARSSNTVPMDALSDILNALEDLHSLGYKHRDLKPQNVLLHEGRWKLSDFGLVLPPDSSTTLTSTLSAWGTPSYCAPEQMQDFKRSDHRADIYAFGCILHDIFEGSARIPYGRQTAPGPIGVVIERCTEPNPGRRFQDIGKVRAALFTTLAKPGSLTPSIEAADWAKKLSTTSTWELTTLHDFVRFIVDPKNARDTWILFEPLDEANFMDFVRLDQGYAETIALEYSDWVRKGVFSYEFCDVLAQRLKSLTALPNMDVKANAIMALARLGKSHNRWYVMRTLIRLSNGDMDLRLAERIAIEIQVEDAYWDFVDSATRTSNTIDAFHPIIYEVLEKRINRYKS